MAEIKCDKFGCVANLNGECVLDECGGELIQRPPCSCTDREKLRKHYEVIRSMFDEDFRHTDIREQMRQDGLCEEDIELAVSAIDELKKRGRENG